MQAAAFAAEADGVAPPFAPKPILTHTQALGAAVQKVQNDFGNTNEDDADDDNESSDEVKESHKDDPAIGASSNINKNSTALNQMLADMDPPNQATSQDGLSRKPSSITTDSGGEEQKKQPLRRGKWTPEEEAYANRLIQEFKAGLLPLTDGTTLRTFLSKLLNCDPMRISKKFVGGNCIGKQVFRRRGDINNLTPEQVQQTRMELSDLEKKFLDRVSPSKSSKSPSLIKSKSSEGIGGTGIDGMNRSAAAAGRALLQSNKTPQTGFAGGLLAQMQSQQPGMFDNSTATSYLANAGGNKGGMGRMGNDASINNLMMQTGLNRDQIAQLASHQMTSSASLANLLSKQRSFDGLMSLDFQSMQSIDNLANLIQAGMPHQVPNAERRNVDWGSQGLTNTMPPAAGLQGSGSMQGSLENLVRTLSGNRNVSAASAVSGGFSGFGVAQQGSYAAQANANFGNIMPNSNLLQMQPPSFNANLGNLLKGIGNNTGAVVGGGGGSSGNDIQSLLQNLQNNHSNINNAGTGKFPHDFPIIFQC